MKILSVLVVAGALAFTMPSLGEAQQPCDEECVVIVNPSGQTIGMGCIYLPHGLVGGFNCHADVDGCDIERTGCGEMEEDALLSAEDRQLVFGQGFIQSESGTLLYALVPCALSKHSLFVVGAEVMTSVDMGPTDTKL